LPAPSVEPSLSVIIPTYRRPETVALVLAALAKQTFPAEQFEVIVVLDGPQPETRQRLSPAAFTFCLTVLEQPHRGAPAARNTGARHARAEILLFLDDDILPVPGLLAAHYSAHAGKKGIVAFGGFCVSPESPFPFVAQATDWSREHWERCSAPDYIPTHRDLPDGNFSIRRHHLEDAGGWDEAFAGCGGDDDRELAVRLLRTGLRLRFVPAALGYHYYAKDLERHLKDMYAAAASALHYAAKHPDLAPEMQFAFWAVRPWWSRTLFHLPRFVPGIFFSAALSLARRAEPLTRGRRSRLLRCLARLSGFFFYAKGFWKQGPEAWAAWRHLRWGRPGPAGAGSAVPAARSGPGRDS
jgi:GT2 family glycosyltransferase